MSGFELVVGIVAAFFAFGIMTGAFAVIALSAVRDDRKRATKRLDRGDRLGWEEPLGPDDADEAPPRWPGYRG